MRSFAHRSDEPELMDAPDLGAGELEACLKDLARTNTLTLARPPTMNWLAKAVRPLGVGARFTLLDVGCGHGDMLRAVDRWARRAGLRPNLTGIDLNPASIGLAHAASGSPNLRFGACNVFDYRPDEPIDFVISSLVTHHMPDALLVRFIGWMEANARQGWFINDLHRHPLAYYGFMALSTATRMDPMVRHDGKVSVARAFVRRDWERYLAAAGLCAAETTISWRFPFRICVGRLK
jgi:SAM-dependent methyltransferase